MPHFIIQLTFDGADLGGAMFDVEARPERVLLSILISIIKLTRKFSTCE